MTIKYLQRLRAKKGVTLVELVIAMAIFTLLLTAVFSMYQPVVDIANMVKGDSDMQRVVTAGEQFVMQQMRSSPEIHVIWNGGGFTWAQTNFATNFRNNRNPSDLPQALVLHEGQIYNVRLSETTGAITSTILTDPRWRVFNDSFYDDIVLDFNVAIHPQLPGEQRRGNVWFQMQVDGLRRDNSGGLRVDMNSRRLSDTQLTWIGNVGSSGDGENETTGLRARVSPPLQDCGTVCSGPNGHRCVAWGTIVIFYLGNMDFTAELAQLRCGDCDAILPCDCTV
jgi:prepilin-type N-terminal cleavage/methylation domain-containing protein